MDKQQHIKKFYEDNFSDYDSHMRQTGHYDAQAVIISEILDEIKEPVLDLACGTGVILKLLADIFTKLAGNDFSLPMVKVAERETGLQVSNDNAETLESHSRKYGTIICCNLFYYIQNKSKAISRWKELLDEGGHIIILEEFPFGDPNKGKLDQQADELLELVDPMSPEEIEAIMKNQGFDLKKKAQTTIDEKHDLYGSIFAIKSKEA